MLEFIYYMLDINIYNKYRDSISINNDYKELYNLYKELDYLITSYQRTITFNEYKVHVLQKYNDYDVLLDKIEASNLGLEFVQDKFKELKEKQLAYELALLAVDVNEGNKPIQTIFDFYDKFESIDNKEHVEFVTDDLDKLYDTTVKQCGLRWRLNTLNKMLGSLRKGDFGFVFARPETGKTTFLASEVTYFAEQIEQPILWFNNEEGGAKVKTRIYQASLGVTLAQLYSNRKGAADEYMNRTQGRIKLFDSASIHKRQVEQIVKELKPGLIIFDQIDKVKGFDADREDLRLGSIYIWARELAKKYCPVIGVCQSDVSGEGKKWLTMDNVANAKCLAPTTKVLMANGDWKQIQNIQIGEQVMGIDSTPRNVLDVAFGKEEMYSISHKIGGDQYVVNKSHLLSLKDKHGKAIVKNVLDYCKTDFGYRVPHELPEQSFVIDPYYLGITKDLEDIPHNYFKGSIKQRSQLIAGMLDIDGKLVNKKYEYVNKNYLLASGLKVLALSCGLMATLEQRGDYYYVLISGNDLSIIPLKRNRSSYKSHKDVTTSPLEIKYLGIGDYAGILIDGDHQFIIEGNIVTHNTSKQAEADWILGIGATHDPGFEYVRYLHVSKNKLSGDEDSDPTLRHGRVEVLIKPDIARYGDLV